MSLSSSVQGEMIRSNLVDGKPGVPVHLEMQFVDTTSCKPATSLLIDVWSCDAMGIYSGVSAAGQGGLNTNYLRGVQPTDADGVVEFDIIFPGHYGGRATHEHIVTHTGATILANGSYSGGHISHLSQIFFDQALIDAVERTSPYSTNTIAKTSNNADGYTGYSASAAYDPFPEWMMLGSSISDGLFVWIELGINPTQDVTRYAPPAAFWGANGGTNNPSMDMSIVGTPPPTHG
jgi:protocatechuate 3,4-dioxygenase beta subunit